MYLSRIWICVAWCFTASLTVGATVWDGVYTVAQAEKGRAAYLGHCSMCHREDLSGYQGVLKGDHFMDHWREDALISFFSTMKSTMPAGAPGTLADGMYLDLAAYIMQANNFPAGSQELTSSALANIRVERKSGPEELPVGALVDVVGCLNRTPEGSWILTKVTTPVRTRNPNDSSAAELKSIDVRPLGSRRMGLMDAASYHPEPNRRVEAKGFLIKDPGEDRINLTALQPTGSSCDSNAPSQP